MYVLLETFGMKFKTIFILFNAILIFSFAFIFLMPFFLLGAEYSTPFWLKNWPLFTVFAAVLVGFNIFFVLNWRLFSLLEAEDWEALGALLVDRVLVRKRYNRRMVRLLVNTSLLRGDMATIERLESALRDARPSALRRDALLFGAARMLKNDAQASERFLSEFVDGRGVDNAQWLLFYYGFVQVMREHFDEATPHLRATVSSKDPVLAAMSAYILGSLCAVAARPEDRQGLIDVAEAVRSRLARSYDATKWAREAERAKGEVHIVILSRILDEAGGWLFASRD